MPSVRLAALAALATILFAACAEAPPPMTPAQPNEPPPVATFSPGQREVNPLDAEMLKIAGAEEQIDRLFPHAGESKAGQRSGGKKGAEPEKPAPTSSGAEDSCAVACRALASMRSSADHLCQLSGENDGRCEDARTRVRGASTRVKSACPACATAGQP